MEKQISTKEGINIITSKVIEEHIKDIKKSKENGTFKDRSNNMVRVILGENPELSLKVIQTTLESDKPEEFKKGYLAGIATLYDLLRKQGRKSKKQD